MTELRKVTILKTRAFFHSEEGQELLAFLREATPLIQKGPEHEIILDAGRSKGWSECISNILKQAESKVEPSDSAENPGLS